MRFPIVALAEPPFYFTIDTLNLLDDIWLHRSAVDLPEHDALLRMVTDPALLIIYDPPLPTA